MDDYTVANAKAMLTIKYGKTAIKIDTKRLLTSGEVALAQLIFKNSIDYTKVYIRRGGLGGDTRCLKKCDDTIWRNTLTRRELRKS